MAMLEAALVPDERARMARFAFADDRARYAAGRGLLRHVLGLALDAAPDAVPLVEGVNGRPVLAHASRGAPPVAFNVSHSGDRLAIALARVPAGTDAALPLGVDVEVVRTIGRMDAVERRVFDEAERAALDARGDTAARLRAFHRLWTRKEACMKATGAGFALAPHTFHVDADAPVQRVALPAHACAPEGIVLIVHALPVEAGLEGAVAVAGDHWTVDRRQVG